MIAVVNATVARILSRSPGWRWAVRTDGVIGYLYGQAVMVAPSWDGDGSV